MEKQRFDRNIRFFGEEGQRLISATKVAVIGVGGLGTQVVQQLALLGVKCLALVDHEELDSTNRNRYVGVRHDDAIPGTLKTSLGARIAREIDPEIRVQEVPRPLKSAEAFEAVIGSSHVFGCLDNEGSRLILNELCAAYSRPYLDLASDIVPDSGLVYGGRVFTNLQDRAGCLVCSGELDLLEAQTDLMGNAARLDRSRLYGVDKRLLTHQSGPSVVSINGVVSSLAVTEFLVAVTGIRNPVRFCEYRADAGKVLVSTDEPAPDCYYCVGIRGQGAAAKVERYLEESTATCSGAS